MKFNSNNLIYHFSPITEEALLIGLAIVAVLIVIGLVFGIFSWIGEKFSELFISFGP